LRARLNECVELWADLDRVLLGQIPGCGLQGRDDAERCGH